MLGRSTSELQNRARRRRAPSARRPARAAPLPPSTAHFVSGSIRASIFRAFRAFPLRVCASDRRRRRARSPGGDLRAVFLHRRAQSIVHLLAVNPCTIRSFDRVLHPRTSDICGRRRRNTLPMNSRSSSCATFARVCSETPTSSAVIFVTARALARSSNSTATRTVPVEVC